MSLKCEKWRPLERESICSHLVSYRFEVWRGRVGRQEEEDDARDDTPERRNMNDDLRGRAGAAGEAWWGNKVLIRKASRRAQAGEGEASRRARACCDRGE